MEIQENHPGSGRWSSFLCGDRTQKWSSHCKGIQKSERRSGTAPPKPGEELGWRWRRKMSSMRSPSVAAAGGDASFRAAEVSGLGTSSFGFGGGHPKSTVDDGRWRELFPLQNAPLPDRLPGLSTSARRRRAKVRDRVCQVNSIVDCLNEMYVPSSQVSSYPQMESQAQRDSQHYIFQQLNRMKYPSSTCTEREAVKELLQTSTSYEGGQMTTVRPYERDLVSLPDCGAHPIALEQVIDAAGRDFLEDPHVSMMRTAEEWGHIIEKDDVFRPYMDVTLQGSPKKYVMFVKDLIDKGMVDFTARPKDLVTPFFVKKKNGKLRFILDCRGVNKRLAPPPPLALAAGSTWSQISLGKKDTLYVAQSDIKDYFYSLALPEPLRAFFCLPPVSWDLIKEVMPSNLAFDIPDHEGWLWPQLRVIPMGWNWAMWIAQRVHQHISLTASNLDMSRVLVEGKPAPDLSDGGVVLIPYADNLNVAGVVPGRVQEIKDKVVKELRRLGFRVHEETEACDTAQSLGFYIDGARGVISPIPERLDKVVKSFAWLSRRPRVSGRMVERLVGHAVHFCMLRRELLSIFRSLYDFIYGSYDRRCNLWRSAAREARWASQLLHLCSVDLRRQWSDSTTASDASLSGVAVCSAQLREADQVKHGNVKETWRYKSRFPVRPRESAMKDLDPFADPETVKPLQVEKFDAFELDVDFPEVDDELLQPSRWHDVFSVHMQLPEPITILEGRGVVAALRHKLRSSNEFGRKHLHFNDNMSVVLMCSKGRSSSFGMLRVCRRIACLLIASDCQLSVRWIPSEKNIADRGSRQWEHLRQEKNASASRSNRQIKEDIDQLCYPNRSPKYGTSFSSLRWSDEAYEEEEKNIKRRSIPQECGGEEGLQISEDGRAERLSPLPWSDGAGEVSCFETGGHGLSKTYGRPEKFCSKKSFEPEAEEQIRRGLLQVSQQHVRARIRPARRHKDTGGHYRCLSRLWPEAHVTSLQESASGMAESGASEDKTSSALVPGCSHSHADAREQTPAGGSRSPLDVHLLPKTWRSPGHTKDRPHSTNAGNHNILAVAPSSQSKRTIKSGTLRRKHPTRLTSSSMVGSLVATPANKEQFSHRSSIRSVGSSLASCPPEDKSGSKSCRDVSVASQRAFLRPTSSTSVPGRGETKRPVGKRQINEEIRGPCSNQPGVLPTPEGRSGPLPQDGEPLSHGGPKIFWNKDRWQKMKGQPHGKIYVLELFSGCARLSKACAEQGFIVFSYDIEYGSECDLLQSRVVRKIKKFLKKHCKCIALVWFGTPCTSWSRARRNDGGPKPLRDDAENLMGFSNLEKPDADKIQQGNLFLDVTTDIIHYCTQLNIAWALENPFSSRIWLTRPLTQLKDDGALFTRRFLWFWNAMAQINRLSALWFSSVGQFSMQLHL